VLLLALVIAAIPAGRRPFWSSDEARVALLARDVLSHNDWLVAEIRGHPYLNKPQLFFWSVAAAALPFGRVTEMIAAIPALVSSLAGVAGVIAVGRLLWGWQTGALAGLILVTTPLHFEMSHQVLPDVMLNAWLVWALYWLGFKANAGLSAAFHAGYEAARGRIVATIDADLQNDPRELQALLAALDGADAAVGWRRERHDPWPKRGSSRVANVIRDWMTGDSVRDSASSLRVMRRECLRAIPPYCGMHRFVPTLLRMAGYRVVEVPVRHRPRRFGRSKFGVRNRALRAFVDLLVVRWMIRRALRYQVEEVMPATPPHGRRG
jgi:hypothetical protein